MISNSENNKVYLCGTIVSQGVFSHEVFGEGFRAPEVGEKTG